MKCYTCSKNAAYAYRMSVEVALGQLGYIAACGEHIFNFFAPWYKGTVIHLSSCMPCSGIGYVKETYWNGSSRIYTDKSVQCPGCDGKCISPRAIQWIKDNPVVSKVA